MEATTVFYGAIEYLDRVDNARAIGRSVKQTRKRKGVFVEISLHRVHYGNGARFLFFACSVRARGVSPLDGM